MDEQKTLTDEEAIARLFPPGCDEEAICRAIDELPGPKKTVNLIRPEELEQRFGWRRLTANKLVKSGKLPYIRLPNGEIRFDEDEINALIETWRVPATSPD